MRALAALLAWLATTALLTVAVPATWVQHQLLDEDGFAALSQQAARNPVLQNAVAGELATQAVWLIRERGFAADSAADSAAVRDIAAAYTGDPSFPPRFARVMRGAHRSIFADTSSDEWVVDLAAMLDDSAFRATMADYQVAEPATLVAPLAVPVPESLRAGQLRTVAQWGWLGTAAGLLAGVSALLTLAAARRRGRALTALGIAALLAGGIGWAGVEVVRHQLGGAVAAGTEAAVRQIAEVMIATGIDSLHRWLNLTLAGGALLAVAGVIVALLGGLRRGAAA